MVGLLCRGAGLGVAVRRCDYYPKHRSIREQGSFLLRAARVLSDGGHIKGDRAISGDGVLVCERTGNSSQTSSMQVIKLWYSICANLLFRLRLCPL